MNVCIITSEFITESNFDGGLANYNYKLAKSLIKAGHKAIIIVSSRTNGFTEYEDIPVHRVNVHTYDDFLFRSKLFSKTYSKVKKYLKTNTGVIMSVELKTQSRLLNEKFRELHAEEKFDLIHYSSLGAVGMSRPKDVPVVSRISGATFIAHQMGGYGESDAAVRTQQKMEFNTLKKMDGIFGPSRMIAEYISKEIDRDIRIIETPFLFPDYELDASAYKEKLEGKKYLLFFGSLGLIKGCGTIAEIIEKFFDRYPEYHFVFVGKVLASPEKGTNMLTYLNRKAGRFADRIIHFDKMPHATLFPIIQKSEFAVLPSRIDNFPNTCIEAMGNGKIVIGTRGNGFEQMIEHKKNGYLVDVDKPDQLLETIAEIIELSAVEKQKMEDNARSRIGKLSPEIIIEQLVELYSEVIKRKRNN